MPRADRYHAPKRGAVEAHAHAVPPAAYEVPAMKAYVQKLPAAILGRSTPEQAMTTAQQQATQALKRSQ